MNFKAERESRDWTLEKVAELSGYKVATINGLELHGEGSDRLKQKLAEVYGKQNPNASLRDAAPESELEIWKRRAKKAEAELHELKTKMRALLEK